MVDEKYYLSEKMTRYVLDADKVSQSGGWCKGSVVNPSIAHAITVRGVGGGTESRSRELCSTRTSTRLSDIETFGNVGNGKTQSRTVYGVNGICPTLCSGMDHGNTIPFVVVGNEG